MRRRWLILAAAVGVAADRTSTPFLFVPAAVCPRGGAGRAPIGLCRRRHERHLLRCAEEENKESTPEQDVQALRRNIRAAKGAAKREIESLGKEDASSILGRMNVPRPEDSAKRGTSTTFLVEELKVGVGWRRCCRVLPCGCLAVRVDQNSIFMCWREVNSSECKPLPPSFSLTSPPQNTQTRIPSRRIRRFS